MRDLIAFVLADDTNGSTDTSGLWWFVLAVIVVAAAVLAVRYAMTRKR